MLASCVALLLASAQGAVIGIDLGSRFLKVGIIQPGTGIELVLNEATKRKSSAVAGFNAEEERIYGDESYNLLGKLPEKQFLFSKMLLGKPLDSPEVKLLKELGYPYAPTPSSPAAAAHSTLTLPVPSCPRGRDLRRPAVAPHSATALTLTLTLTLSLTLAVLM